MRNLALFVDWRTQSVRWPDKPEADAFHALNRHNGEAKKKRSVGALVQDKDCAAVIAEHETFSSLWGFAAFVPKSISICDDLAQIFTKR